MQVAFAGTEMAPLDPVRGALEGVVVRWALELSEMGGAGRVDLVSFGPVPGEVARSVSGKVTEVGSATGMRSCLAAIETDIVVLQNRPLWGRWVRPGAAQALHLFHNFSDAWGCDSEADQALSREILRCQTSAAVSRALAGHVDLHRELDGVGCLVVPPSIDPVFLETEYRPDDSTVLVPGRLMRKKGVEVALALAALPGCRHLRFVFVDNISPWQVPTAEHLELRALVEDAGGNVELAKARRPGAEMAELYSRARVVLCPSVVPEGLGLVALEAQAVGCPLVTSGLGGLAEVTFPPNECVDPADLPALGAALLSAASRAGESQPGSLPFALAPYTPRASAEALMAAICSAVDPGSRPAVHSPARSAISGIGGAAFPATRP
jgi:glycosyltransferase involved in cell wall biosynthesis